MSRKLIGFLGKAGVGKTTLANAIIEMGQYPFQKYAFADGVREIARKAFPQYGFKKPYSSNERDILVAVGQTAREIHPNYWVELLGKKIQDKSYVIIDDIRFQNEVDFLKNQGFLIVKLECPDYIRQKRIGYLPDEKYIDDVVGYNIVLNNIIEEDIDMIKEFIISRLF